MTSYDQSEIQLTAVVRIDVAHPNAVHDASALHRLPTHSRVIVEVGEHQRADDPRVLDFLAQHARERCLHLEVHGYLDAVAAWIYALRRYPPPRRRAPLRHLAPVEGGDAT